MTFNHFYEGSSPLDLKKVYNPQLKYFLRREFLLSPT